MILRLSTAVRDARLTAFKNALDADVNPGYIEFYTAPMPATGGDAITTQTLLGMVTLSNPSGTVDAGELTLNTVTDDLAADNSGDIAWARFYDGSGTWAGDGDCGDQASNALVKLNSVSVLQGGAIKISSGVLTEGNA